MNSKPRSALLLLATLLLIATAGPAPAQQSADLVVYGGTASGVMTAYSAARVEATPRNQPVATRAVSRLQSREGTATLERECRVIDIAVTILLEFRIKSGL